MEKKKVVKKKVIKINSNEVICAKCGDLINTKSEPYLIFSRRNFKKGQLINKTLPDNDIYFHAFCWRKDLDDQVKQLFQEKMKESMEMLKSSGLNFGSLLSGFSERK